MSVKKSTNKVPPTLSRMKSWLLPSINNYGLTLIELMIAVALSGFVISAIYMSFKAQQRATVVQENVTDMQQNLRAATFMMSSEIRMAGYDPTGLSGAGIVSANATSIRFTMDIFNADGDILDSNEDITYGLYSADGVPTLGRKNPTNNAAVAEYIDYLEFQYKDGSNSTLAAPVATPSNIRNITITLMSRSRIGDTDYTNTNNYPKLSGGNINLATDTLNPPDVPTNFRRRQLTTTINCRNMGL